MFFYPQNFERTLQVSLPEMGVQPSGNGFSLEKFFGVLVFFSDFLLGFSHLDPSVETYPSHIGFTN